jgi:hypothetical protein
VKRDRVSTPPHSRLSPQQSVSVRVKPVICRELLGVAGRSLVLDSDQSHADVGKPLVTVSKPP